VIWQQKRLNLIKYLIFISNQAILASRLGLGLQINLQICGFYEGLLNKLGLSCAKLRLKLVYLLRID
jgi:hypothetical protein